MIDTEKHQARIAYFNSRYWKIAHHWFRTAERTELRDHADEANRRCRFCDQGRPDVKFKKLAHAIADFLGNLSIVSLNECDDCNKFFGDGCEDHLSKAMHLARTLAGIPRKDSTKSTFKDRIKDETLRIESDGHIVNMRVPEPNSVDDLLVNGELPYEIPLLGDTRSQPYSPIQAAMALVKFACSICPKQELAQCRGAIDWVRGRLQAQFSGFPVLFAHTPGTFDEQVSHAILLRRKDDGPEPYLWFSVQFRAFRLQVPVPFCPADGGKLGPPFEHYPSMFPPDWPCGPTQFSWFDWAGVEKVRTSWTVSHHRTKTIAITRPGQEAT
jgi:hypothetical protein